MVQNPSKLTRFGKKKVCTALHCNFTVEMNILYYYLNWACLATAVGNKRPVQTSYWLVETVTSLVTAENCKRPVCVGLVWSFPRLGISRTGYGYGLRHSRPKDQTGLDFQTLCELLKTKTYQNVTSQQDSVPRIRSRCHNTKKESLWVILGREMVLRYFY